MKDYLKKIIAAKEARAAELRALIEKSEDVKEVRALGDTLQKVLDELNDAKTQLAKVEEEEANNAASANEGRSAQVAGATFNPVATFGARGAGAPATPVDNYDTKEYRNAFMNFVCRGTVIPNELRATTATTDIGAVIPTTLVKEIVKELRSYGNIYAKVRKLNVQGGVEIPVLSLKPVANWIGETPSEDQKLEAKSKITFSYFGLECKISQTLLASIVALDAFEQEFVPLAVEAITKALEIAILNGDGNGKALGVTKDTRVPAANVITLASTDIGTWGGWKKKVFAKMKKAYRNGTFFMAQGTFDGYIDGMEDKQGQPIGRVNYGIDGGETYRFGGKPVETVEDDIIASYETAAEGDVIAVFVNLNDYAINSNMQMTTVKWTDHDTNEVKNKVMLIVDGKLIDPNGVLIIKKGA